MAATRTDLDPVARLLVRTGHFRGKRRLLRAWSRRQPGERERVLPGGLSMTLDLRSDYEANVWLGLEEQDELAVLEQRLGPGDVFVDCGSNLGLWALVAAPVVGADGLVVAFEANPATVERLRTHAGAADDVIEVHHAAVSDRPGVLRFEPGDSHNVSHVDPNGSIEVPATTLDEVLTRPVRGIKIDVEGQELAVLRGAARVLEDRPWLAVEFNLDHSPSPRLGDWPVHAHLAGLGYRAETFRGEPVGEGWVLRRDYTNLLYTAP